MQVGTPDTVLGYPIITDPNCASFGTAASTAKPILFGNFRDYYALRDAGVQLTSSVDFAYDRDLISYRVLQRLDGKVQDSRCGEGPRESEHLRRERGSSSGS